jgi:hypothetical protein
MEYFYAGQLRAYRVQLIRAFSNFYVNFGTESEPNLKRVPCRYGDSSRLAEMILSGGSDNTMPSAPFISVYVTGMSLAPERRAAPSLVSTLNVNEREYEGRYLDTPGNRYTVKRYMPVPFTMTINVDMWTTNLTQKEELFEQTQVLFNGMMDIQTSNNPLDWTLFSTIEPTNITWSSRTIPMGTDNPIDVMTVEYRVPVFINPPALVTYQKLIEQVVTNINTSGVDEGSLEWTQADLLARQITTPDNARIGVQLVDDHLYEISLKTVGGLTQDEQQQPTVIRARTPAQLNAGESFLINGIPVTIPNNSVDDLIAVMRQQFQGKNLNVRLNLRGVLELVNLSGGHISLINVSGQPVQSLGFVETTYPGGELAWWRLLEKYGSIEPLLAASACEPGSVISGSELRLLRDDDLDQRHADVVGIIQLHPTNQNLLVWRVLDHTWPQATLTDVTAIINPQSVYPGNGLASAAAGQRYLLVDEIAESSAAWGAVTADVNDIIEYDGTRWVKVFDHTQSSCIQFVKNQFSQRWFQFDSQTWQSYPPPHVMPGYWRLKL